MSTIVKKVTNGHDEYNCEESDNGHDEYNCEESDNPCEESDKLSR